MQIETETAGPKRKHKITANSTRRQVKKARLHDDPTTTVGTGPSTHHSEDGDSTYAEESIKHSDEENTMNSPFVSESLDIAEDDDEAYMSESLDIAEEEDEMEDEGLRAELLQKSEKAKELLTQAKEHLFQQDRRLGECVNALENLHKQQNALQKKKTAFCSLKRSEVCFQCHHLTTSTHTSSPFYIVRL